MTAAHDELVDRFDAVLRAAVDLTATQAERAAQLLAAELELWSPRGDLTPNLFALAGGPPPPRSDANQSVGDAQACITPTGDGEASDVSHLPPEASEAPPNTGVLVMRVLATAMAAYDDISARAHSFLAREIRLVANITVEPYDTPRTLRDLTAEQLTRILEHAQVVAHAFHRDVPA